MRSEEKEKVLDLLCDKFVYGLSDEQTAELERLGYDAEDAESIEKTITALGLIDVNADAPMPASLQAKLTRDADRFFGSSEEEARAGRREVTDNAGGRWWFGWLGWAAAAAACVALAVSLFTRPDDRRANIPPMPTPTPVEQLTPEQQRQRLMDSPGQLIRADWAPGKMSNISVSGDVVWSEEKQAGYIRLKGLPRNDPAKETYQLWIVDGEQDPKTPIDGGVFDINSDGEVIIPIDAKIRVRDPKAFAITIERPGGVVVSRQERLPALAPVKPV